MCKNIFKKISGSYLLGGIVSISAVVLIAAFIMERYFSIHPCQLCLYERNVFMAAGIWALLSLVLLPTSYRRLSLFGLALIFTGGTFLAAYHVAVQQHWVTVPAFCASQDFSSFKSVDTLKEQLLKTPFVRCDKVTWSLFGFSLAFYNMLLSAFLMLLCWGWLWKKK